jgi:hypothetical protein
VLVQNSAIPEGAQNVRLVVFSKIDSNPLISAATQRTLSPLVQQRLMSQTQQGLTRRGLRFVEDPSEAVDAILEQFPPG